jgi:restriction system protein
MNISNGVQGAGKIDVPQFQYLMLPLLKVMGGGHEMSTIQIRDAVADNLFMTAEVLSQHLPTGPQNAFNNSTEWVQYLPIESQNKINNRMGWAITFLYKACLLERPRKATYIISEIGKQVLLDNPVEIDAELLRSYGDFNKFYDSLNRRIGTLLPADSTNKQLTEEGEIEISPSKIHRQLRDKIKTEILQVYYLNSID